MLKHIIILAMFYRELEQLDAAINSYEKAIVINPNYVEAHYSLGLTFQDLGKLERYS